MTPGEILPRRLSGAWTDETGRFSTLNVRNYAFYLGSPFENASLPLKAAVFALTAIALFGLVEAVLTGLESCRGFVMRKLCIFEVSFFFDWLFFQNH